MNNLNLINPQQFLNYNSRILKRPVVIIKLNPNIITGGIIKNIIPENGRYEIFINISIGKYQKLYWYGTYNNYKPVYLNNGNNKFIIDIKNQKESYEIGILGYCNVQINMYIKNFNITKINESNNNENIITKKLNEDEKKIISENKNICIITDSCYPGGGGEEFMYDLCVYFNKKNFNVYWLSFTKWGGIKHNKYDIIKNDIYTDIYLYNTGITDDQAYYLILNEISKYNFGLILHQGLGHKLMTNINILNNIPTITFWCFWEEALNINHKYGYVDILKNINNHSISNDFNYIINNIDYYYFASKFMINIINQKYKLTINQDHIFPTLSLESRIHSSNRDSIYKKYITLLDSHSLKGGVFFSLIMEKLPSFDFMALITENEKNGPDAIRKIINKTGNKENLLIERVNNVSNLYDKTKILLCPTYLDETFCRVVFEAYYNEIPVICSNRGNLQILENKNVLVLNNHDVDQYVDLIIKLNNDTNFYDEIVKKQKKIYYEMKEKFSFDIILDKYYEIKEKKNIAIFTTWSDQGIGIQARIYDKILTEIGYNTFIFNTKPYVKTSKENLVNDSNEWLHNRIYNSPNKRLDVTKIEIEEFVKTYNIKKFIIIEIQFQKIFDIESYLKELNVDTYAVPNIECIRDYELEKFNIFTKILTNNNFSKTLLNDKNINTSLLSFSYDIPKCINFKYCEHDIIKPGEKIKLLHLSGLNGLFRKRTLEIVDIFDKIYQKNNNFELIISIQGNFDENKFKSFNKPYIKLLYEHKSYSDILKLYQEVHISIHFSKHEGLGLGFHESCYLGTPVLTLDAPPHNEIIHHNKNGWLLPCYLEKDEILENPYTIVKQIQIDLPLLVIKITEILSDIENINKVIKSTKNYYNSIYNIEAFKNNFRSILK